MSNVHYQYFTFPVTILQGAFKDMPKVCQDAIKYSVYDFARKESGSISESTEKAFQFLDLKIVATSRLNIYTEGQKIFNSIPKGTPRVSLKSDLVWDFHNNHKDEFEIVIFLAFAALRSILGAKSYSKTNNSLMLARMAGNAKPGKPLPEVLEKYNNRYQLDRIKSELQQNWKLQIYGRHTKGFYFSFKLSLKELVLEAETKRKTYKQKQMKEQQKEAYNAAITALYGKKQ